MCGTSILDKIQILNSVEKMKNDNFWPALMSRKGQILVKNVHVLTENDRFWLENTEFR